jgi:hypothetical protein
VNSEELEQSLRTEFESYLKNVLADMRQEVSEFQKQFESEFEKHKAQIDEVFQNFSARVASDRELDSNFTESVVEHLRLSRDEGARITAMAIAEAEELEKQQIVETPEAAAPTFSYSEIRDAINDISSKTTQSAILKTLVNHAAQFTPRGAFFIIKNEHLVGWRIFGKDGETVDEHTVREVFFPVASSTVLGEAVRSLSAVESSYGVYQDDSIYLNKLEFGHPDQMFAVPLVVRGRSVAVLYADPGAGQEAVNVDALETLVRVASLTVEILASSRGAQTQPETEETTAPQSSFEEPVREVASESPVEYSEPVEEAAPVEENSYQFAETAPVEENLAETAAPEESFTYTAPIESDYSYQPIEQPAETLEEPSYQTSFESDSFSFKPSAETETAVSEEAVEEVSAEEEKAPAFEAEPAWNRTVETEDYYSNDSSISYETPSSFETPSYETERSAYEISEPQAVETETAVAEAEDEYTPRVSENEYQFEAQQPYEAPQTEFETASQTYETPAYEAPTYEAESFAPTNGAAYEPVATENGKAESYVTEAPAEPVVEPVVKQPAKSRFSERNVDLPIEVSEDERRLHNDARRFARLLVSEIKLYNEQKVKEGRDSNDLYDRLREAIDRSREMYDKRVQPPVAAKFDYFHYEIVSNLAEGDAAKLGASYPGSSV